LSGIRHRQNAVMVTRRADTRASILLVGGAPRVPVDAVRHLVVAASGRTACRLAELLSSTGCPVTLLLGADCASIPIGASRFTTRTDLDDALAGWCGRHPAGTVVMTAAVNDYEVTAGSWGAVRLAGDALRQAKIPSGQDRVLIELAPAPKLVDALRRTGFTGRLVACKYEDAATVIAAATALRARIDAVCVVANSLCGSVQALVDAGGVHRFPDRESLLVDLARRLTAD
jgi:phosphopantothenoylcysteine synthetase/decarboxylase